MAGRGSATAFSVLFAHVRKQDVLSEPDPARDGLADLTCPDDDEDLFHTGLARERQRLVWTHADGRMHGDWSVCDQVRKLGS